MLPWKYNTWLLLERIKYYHISLNPMKLSFFIGQNGWILVISNDSILWWWSILMGTHHAPGTALWPWTLQGRAIILVLQMGETVLGEATCPSQAATSVLLLCPGDMPQLFWVSTNTYTSNDLLFYLPGATHSLGCIPDSAMTDNWPPCTWCLSNMSLSPLTLILCLYSTPTPILLHSSEFSGFWPETSSTSDSCVLISLLSWLRVHPILTTTPLHLVLIPFSPSPSKIGDLANLQARGFPNRFMDRVLIPGTPKALRSSSQRWDI